MRTNTLMLLVAFATVFSAVASAEDKVNYEAAIVEASREGSVTYKEIFGGDKQIASLEEKTFKVTLETKLVFNPGARLQYRLLEITVTDPADKDRVIAYYRQYVADLKDLNNVVFKFSHPKTAELWVVGFRSSTGTKRMMGR